jgi:hypothetical protein
MFTMRLTNFESVQRGHQHFLAQNDRLFGESLERSGRHAKDHVNRYPTFKPRTGKLQKRTRTRVVRTRGGKLLRIYNTLEYAAPIDGGAKPHDIPAKNATHLRFYWAKARRWVTTKRVNHPGNKPYKFMYRAWQSAGRVERQELERGMRGIASSF